MKTATLHTSHHPFRSHGASATSHLAFNGSAHQQRHPRESSRHQNGRKNRGNARQEQANHEAAMRATARSQAEQASRQLAQSYLERFLETSEWQDHVDSIGIIDEAVPTMEELESYGDLEEAEGTRACRKMFKAVVVWEQVGHSLWDKLRDDAKEGKLPEPPTKDELDQILVPLASLDDAGRQQFSQSTSSTRDLNGLPIIMEQVNEPAKSRQPSLASLASTLTRGRKPSISSFKSSDTHTTSTTASPASSQRPSPGRRRSSSAPPSRKTSMHPQYECDCCQNGDHDPSRRATDPGPRSKERWSSDETDVEDGQSEPTVRRAATLPQKVSKNCANAMRRTFEALHDPRGRHGNSKRRASVGH